MKLPSVMRITRLKLENFGIHADLDLNMDGAVVGITGENACGKTTVLSAINFAFSGRLPKKQEQYVNYYNGAKSGLVRLEFVHQGTKGVIERSVGAKAYRSLSWGDNSKLTKSAEVEAQLASILNTDRKVWESAVFVPQGELRNILSPQEAVREELMIRLLGLGFCKEVSEAAATHARLLEITFQDLEGSKSEVSLMLEDAERRLSKAQKAVFKPKYTIEHREMLRRAKTIQENILEYRLDLDGLEQAILGCRKILSSEEFSNVSGKIASAEHNLAAWRSSELQPFLELKVMAESGKAQRAHRARLTARVDEATTKLAEASQSVKDTKFLLDEVEGLDTEESISAEISRCAETAELCKSHKARKLLEAELKAVAEETERFDNDTKAGTPRIKDLQSEQERLSTALSELSGDIAAWKSLLLSLENLAGHTLGGECLVCGASVDKNLLGDKIQQHKKEQENKIKRALELEKTLSEVKVEKTSLENERHKLVSRLKRLEDSLGALPETPELPEGVTEEAVSERISGMFLLLKHEKRRKEAAATLETLKSELDNLPEPPPEPSFNFEEKKIQLAQQEDKLQSRLNALLASRNELVSVTTRMQTHLENKNRLLEKMKIENEFQEIASRFLGMVNPRKDLGFPSGLLADCELELEKHAAALADLKAATEAKASLMRRREEIAALEEKDAFARSLAFEMRRLKNAFSREGLPRTYIASVHERLADLTQANLADMDADFSVRPHPDQAVSFQFTRHFGEPVWMSL